MSDTQWPRFYVFKQDTPQDVHLAVGTVHAPDAEMALLNARDVFVRRPECFSLWVARAAEVLVVTREQGEVLSFQAAEDAGGGQQRFHIFLRREREVQHSFAGTVEAPSRVHALQKAMDVFSAEKPRVWWIVPEKAVTISDPLETASWVGSAKDKAYRQPSFYRAQTLMRKVREERSRKGGDS